jgi:hypothetical protein
MRGSRTRALKIIGVGLVIAAVWIAIILVLDDHGRQMMGPGLGLPLVPLLVGLTELVSGRHFDDLAKSWDDLRGWQRGLLGTVIVAIAIVVFVVIGGTIAIVVAG